MWHRISTIWTGWWSYSQSWYANAFATERGHLSVQYDLGTRSNNAINTPIHAISVEEQKTVTTVHERILLDRLWDTYIAAWTVLFSSSSCRAAPTHRIHLTACRDSVVKSPKEMLPLVYPPVSDLLNVTYKHWRADWSQVIERRVLRWHEVRKPDRRQTIWISGTLGTARCDKQLLSIRVWPKATPVVFAGLLLVSSFQ